MKYLTLNLKNKFKEKGLVRFIFQNIYITFFIVMIYYYFSELFGSISTAYINNSSFTVQFGITLVIFTLLAKFFGAFQGLVSGLISEIAYQLAFYDGIYPEWIVLIGFYGLLCGFYKFKPLKYQAGKNIFYTFISLLLSGLLSSLFLIIFSYIIFFDHIDPQVIFIAYGFQFLMQVIISTTIIVPIILYFYDKYLSFNERQIYIEILTHHPITEDGISHTFYLRCGRTKIYLCSRCSGIFLGFLSAFFISHLMEAIWNSQISPELAIFLCIILPLPSIIDWSLQAIKIRSSNTKKRLSTGFLVGFALHMIAFVGNYYPILLFILLTYFTIFFIFVYLKQKKAREEFEKEMNRFATEDQ